ncbi:PDZ domain-containing protein [Sporolactobacillus sp. THM7-7]|nr:PDZ domain-containing protein [Sporolactobacillus sp. THM7-7]
MGYYDDNRIEDTKDSEPVPSRSGRGRGRGGWFFAGFVGAIVGIVCFLIFAPILSDLGVLPYSVTTGNQNTSNTITSPTTFNRSVNLNVKSSVTEAVDKVSPAVVAVVNLQHTNFFDNQYTETGMGSGIIYKRTGQYAYVVTNNHVVEGAGKIEVRLSDNDKIDAKVLGKDALYDLAVLRIPSKNVKSIAEFGNSDTLKRGETAIAIGNPLGFSGSVTEGIISSTKRTIPVQANNASMQAQVLQTDAAINPGNSGGALVNIGGQVIGINSSKIAEADTEGIGFAIPINVAKPVISQLEQDGKIERPLLGISITDLSMVPSYEVNQLQLPDSVKTGLVVTDVQTGSPASRSGLEAGDVITQINGHKITSYIEFSTYMYTQLKPGQRVPIKYYRMGKEHTTELTLGSKTFS